MGSWLVTMQSAAPSKAPSYWTIACHWAVVCSALVLLWAPAPVVAAELPQFLITVDRGAAKGDSIVGQLSVNGSGVGATLERRGVEIAPGTYTGLLRVFSPKG